MLERKDLIAVLDHLRPGLLDSPQDRPPSYIFYNNRVVSWNDDVVCISACPLNGARFQVPAEPLRSLLAKLTDCKIDVRVEGNHLWVKGTNKWAKIKLLEFEEKKIFIGKWKELPGGFEEALKVVLPSAAGKKFNSVGCYVHFHPNRVEACDNHQIARYAIENWDESVLTHAVWTKHLIGSGMTHSSVRRAWVHFKTPTGSISLRRYSEDYPDYSQAFAGEGRAMKMPTGIEGMIDRALVMGRDENVADVVGDDVEIEFKDGRIVVRSKGKYGSYQEYQNEDCGTCVKDKDVSFRVSAGMFKRMLGMPGQCEITDRTLRKISGPCSFAVRLNSK